jgi:hypothetical protein
VWVLIPGWVIVDEEPPLPVAGALLTQVGVRIRGHLDVVDDETPDGVVDLG